jgi:60S ribosomal protein L4 C-terminal domain
MFASFQLQSEKEPIESFLTPSCPSFIFSFCFSPFSLPLAKISNPDVTRIINSTEVQSVLREKGPSKTTRPFTQHKNPLRNRGVLFRLNPYAKVAKRQEIMSVSLFFLVPEEIRWTHDVNISSTFYPINSNQQKKRKGASKKERAEPKIGAGKEFIQTLHAP